MKTKFNFRILLIILLISASSLKAQVNDFDYYTYDNATVVVNNYNGDYDYYFSSRINRFHRSYTAFSYYAPVFTETYWYNYQPYTWGMSIYGGGGLGFGFGYSTGYPVYGYDYGYYRGWNQPYFGNSYYWGYEPYYYSDWYAPVAVNVRIGYAHPVYVNHHHHYGDYNQHMYKSYNYNYSSKSISYSNNSGNKSRRESAYNSGGSGGTETRRYLNPSKDRRVTDDGNNSNKNNRNSGNNGSNNGGKGSGVYNKGKGTATNPGAADAGNRTVNQNTGRSNSEVRTISNSDKKISFPTGSSGNRREGTQYSTGRGNTGSTGSGSVSTRSEGSSSKATTQGKSGNTQTGKSSKSKSDSKSSGSSTSKEKSTQRR